MPDFLILGWVKINIKKANIKTNVKTIIAILKLINKANVIKNDKRIVSVTRFIKDVNIPVVKKVISVIIFLIKLADETFKKKYNLY